MNRNVLVRIATPEPARLWSGPGDLYIPLDDVETEITPYLGGGELLGGLDEIEQLINGSAQRLDVSVSGVSLATANLFQQEMGDLKGAAMDIGVVIFDDAWQISGVTWQARYVKATTSHVVPSHQPKRSPTFTSFGPWLKCKVAACCSATNSPAPSMR